MSNSQEAVPSGQFEARYVAFLETITHLRPSLHLPPMERACVLLKAVFAYSLEDSAELVGSTVGGVKAALSRGRSKLASVPQPSTRPGTRHGDVERLLHLYVDRFNNQDWDGLRELIAADARLRVADRFAGSLTNAPYFANYQRMTTAWRLAVGDVDGEPAIILLHRGPDAWVPHSLVHLNVADGHITRIADFWHTPWILQAASSVVIAQPNPQPMLVSRDVS